MKKWERELHKLMVFCYMGIDINYELYFKYNSCNYCKINKRNYGEECEFWKSKDWIHGSGGTICPYWEQE